MKKIITPALVAMALAGAANAQEARPYQVDARCLSEVMAERGETLDVLDQASVTRATELYGGHWDRTVELIAAENQIVETMTNYLAEVKRLESSGELPQGSVEVERDRVIRQILTTTSSTLHERPRLFPTCHWPENLPSKRLSERIAAIEPR